MTALRVTGHGRVLVVLAVALLILLPLAFVPPQSQQSWPWDVLWIRHFSEQLFAGHPYPRWLPQSHGGMGAPTFYFYAPLPFYVGAIPTALGLSPYAATLATFAIASALMGLTMLRWLAGTRRPLLGALLFMVMPYTLADFHLRAALGEYFAILFIPLVALALRDRRPALLAFAYAGLVFSHLPLALLVSVFFIAPYGGLLVIEERGRALDITAGLVAGLAMASIYLWPALTLQEHILAELFTRNALYIAHNWLLFSDMLASFQFAPVIYTFVALMALAALALLRGQPRWAGASLALLGVVVLGYGLWSLPLLAKVQFPWRALPIAGFLLATAIARHPDPLRVRLAGALLLVGTLLVPLMLERKPLPLSDFVEKRMEVPEYLPAAVPAERIAYPSRWALEQEGTFYFPSLGTSRDGIFLDGEPRLRMLPVEKWGLGASLIGLLLALALASDRVPLGRAGTGRRRD